MLKVASMIWTAQAKKGKHWITVKILTVCLFQSDRLVKHYNLREGEALDILVK